MTLLDHLRPPTSWPAIVWIFVMAVVASELFPTYVEFVAGWPFYYPGLLLLAATLGMAFLASRVCWWLLTLWMVSAMGLAGWSIATGPYSLDEYGWPSWLNIALQGCVTIVLLTPPMLRWIEPFRFRRPAA